MFRHNDQRACCRSLFTQLPELVAEMTAADGVALCAQLVGMRSHYNVAACAALTLAKVLILRLPKPCKPFSELVGCAQTTTSPPSPLLYSQALASRCMLSSRRMLEDSRPVYV